MKLTFGNPFMNCAIGFVSGFIALWFLSSMEIVWAIGLMLAALIELCRGIALLRVVALLFSVNCGATDLILRWEPSPLPNVTYRIRWGDAPGHTYFYTNDCGTNLCGVIPVSVATSIWVSVKAVSPSAVFPSGIESDVPLQPTYTPLLIKIERTACGLAFWAPLYDMPVSIESAPNLTGPWSRIATVGSPEYFPRYKIGVAPSLEKPMEFFRTKQ